MLIQAVWTGAVAVFSPNVPHIMRARVLAVLGLISFGFLLFILLTSNPFDRLFPAVIEGGDLNPLLQDIGLAIHPPMLYIGYIGFSVAFAFSIAALISGQVDSAWARWARPWTNIAWLFLTIGIALVVVVVLMLVLAVGAAIHSHRSATNEKNEKAKKRYKSNNDQIIKIDSESKSTITTANPQHDRSMDRRKGSARIQQVSITDSSNSVHPLTQRTSGSSKDNGSARNNDDKLAPVLINIYNQHIEQTNKYKNPALEVECDKILTL